MGLPDLSVIWVIFFVLLLTFLLSRLLFKPLLAVMHARESAVKSARDLANKAAADATTATEAFEQKTLEARQEIARKMEEARRAAEAERARLLEDAHAQAHGTIAAATAQLTNEANDARQRIARDSTDLAHAIVDRVLGRQTT